MHNHIPEIETRKVLTSRAFSLHLDLTASVDRRPRVLVVDDDPDTVALLTRVLEPEGYEVVAAYSAADAFGAMATARPDVVLLDIKMPGLDGVGALARMHVVYPEAPVIMISAIGNVDLAAGTLRGGAFDYVPKPFDVAHLLTVIDVAIAVRSDRAATRAVVLGGHRVA